MNKFIELQNKTIRISRSKYFSNIEDIFDVEERILNRITKLIEDDTNGNKLEERDINVWQIVRSSVIDSDRAEKRFYNYSQEKQSLHQLQTPKDYTLLYQAIENLPYNYKRAIELNFFDGYQIHEIAQVMECSLGTASRWRKEGLKELKKKIEKTSSVLKEFRIGE